LLAGLPPVVGVYAALVPGIFYALLGTSRQLSVGPVAMDSLLVAASVGAIAEAGTLDYLGAAAVLGLMVGALQALMGLFRMGFLVNFLSMPVVSGFTSAAAIIIGLSQVKHLLGVPLDNSSRLWPLVSQLSRGIAQVQLETAAVGLGAIALLVALKKLRPKWPSALVAVSLGALLVLGFGLEGRVAVVGDVPSGLPHLRMPEVSVGMLQKLLPSAVTIALVSFMESISVSKTYARKFKYQVAPDREFFALGVANLFGAAFQGYPVAGGFSRTAVNAEAGARTPVAALITSAVVGLALLFLTPLFYYMPKAVLAAVIVTAVVGLVDIKEVEHLKRVKKADLVMLLLTFAVTLALGIVQGIAVGVVASLIWMVYKTTRPHLAILGRVPGTRIFRNVARQKGLITYEGVLIVRMDAQFYFGNVAYLREALELAEAKLKSPLRCVVLDASAINQLDSSAETALSDMWEEYRARGVSLVLASVKGPVRDVLQSSGLAERMGMSCRCMTVEEALALVRAVPESREATSTPSTPPPPAGVQASGGSARL
jgi:SulP family sulfate permease